jgi:hypothetical protein
MATKDPVFFELPAPQPLLRVLTPVNDNESQSPIKLIEFSLYTSAL